MSRRSAEEVKWKSERKPEAMEGEAGAGTDGREALSDGTTGHRRNFSRAAPRTVAGQGHRGDPETRHGTGNTTTKEGA
eukprot:14991558-Heterocapsa_arctica.AAC.1